MTWILQLFYEVQFGFPYTIRSLPSSSTSSPIIWPPHSLIPLSAPFTPASLGPRKGQLGTTLGSLYVQLPLPSPRSSLGCCLHVILVTVHMSLPQDAFQTILTKGTLPSSHYSLLLSNCFVSLYIYLKSFCWYKFTAHLSQLVCKLHDGKNFGSLVPHCIPVPKTLPGTEETVSKYKPEKKSLFPLS